MTRAFVHFLRRSITRKLTLTLVGFVAITTIAAGLYLNRALEAFAVDTLEVRLASIGRLLHDEARDLVLREASPADFRAFTLRGSRPTASRVTVIATDGRVLGDSEVAVDELPRVENHGARPEVRAALAGRVGRDRRTSATIGTSLLYEALPISDGGRVIGVLRVALPVAAVTSSYAAIHRVMLAGGVVALAVAFGIGLFVARRVTKPVVQMQAIARQMSEGDFTVRAPIRSPDEIGSLGRALNGLAARLREKIHDLGHEQAKATAILDGMIEGVIAVDGRDIILLMNERARSMLGLDATRGERKPFLEVIRHTERLGRLLNDLTDLSNIELGRVSLKLAPTRLDEVVDTVLAIMGSKAASGRVTLTSRLSADLPPVLADRDRLAQIVINLVDN